MGTFLHITHRVSSRDMTKIGLMILLVRLKFCRCVLNFAGTVFEVKVAPANDLGQKNFAGARQKIPTLDAQLTNTPNVEQNILEYIDRKKSTVFFMLTTR